MSLKEDNLTAYKAELEIVLDSIKNITQSGQSFKKGGVSGFSVEQAKLTSLYAERRELKAKIATWELT